MDTNNTTHEMHIKAFKTNFELAVIFGIIIIIADMIWLAKDVTANGLSFTYVVIAVLMVISFIGTVLVLLRHHDMQIRKLLRRKG